MNGPDTQVAEPAAMTDVGRASHYSYSEPPPGLWSAICSSWFIVLLAVVVGVGAGVAYGLKRQPKYAASARLGVLHLNLGASGALSGFQTASSALADAYSRATDANGIVVPLAKRFHTTPLTVANELSGAAVPQTPLFAITATTPSSSRSVALANAAAQQLITYFQVANSKTRAASVLLSELGRAEGDLSKARTNQLAVQQKANHDQTVTGSATPSAGDLAALSTAGTAVAIATDQVNSLRSAYNQAALGAAGAQYAQLIADARSANSDRASKLGLSAFIGLALGLGIGAMLAIARQERRRRTALWAIRP